MTTIPHLIDYVSPSEAAICLHEAGHATAALVVGLAPGLMEIVQNNPSSPGLARSSIPRGTQQERRIIACAAFAVEFQLYQTGRLVDGSGTKIDEPMFIRLAAGSNASSDKVSFFDANRADATGVWPKADDEAFIANGRQISCLLPMALVTELAEALMSERRLDCPQIIEIGARHLPGSVSSWSCP